MNPNNQEASTGKTNNFDILNVGIMFEYNFLVLQMLQERKSQKKVRSFLIYT